MGMDVEGINPTAPEGEYFRNNLWWWRPLWDYCGDLAPDLIDETTRSSGHTNSGAGLDADGSRKLAARLRKELDSGTVETYAKAYQAGLDAQPDESCYLCDGTGTRNKPNPIDPTWAPKPGECNGCGGKGTRRPFETHYPFSVENVQEWAAFLEACGGFKIW